MADDDPYDLQRFVDAQDAGGTYARALTELRQGLKVSHWMWFVFPQIAGLGHSAMSRRYAISSITEAYAYLRHPLVGPRLTECSLAVAAVHDRSAVQIFGPVDAQKLQSSMTLFHRAAPEELVFQEVLERYFDGLSDAATDARLG
jgi:uncharacterized protein (DUF1810 family)